MAAIADHLSDAPAGSAARTKTSPTLVARSVPSVQKQVIWSVLTQGLITACGVATSDHSQSQPVT